ncbi:hypothetical protein UlMin_045362, partial [Ulmus minor]
SQREVDKCIFNCFCAFEVLKQVTVAANPQAIAHRGAHTKSEFFVPYNILPLDHGGIQQAIMNLPEIKAVLAAVWNICGLPSDQDFQKMDLLQTCSIFFSSFGLQHAQKQTSISKRAPNSPPCQCSYSAHLEADINLK